jgi:hypothetical protein
LSKFINLLQSDYKPPSAPLEDRRNEYQLSKKLSIILSASEPESSSLDKENSNPSANRSFDTGEKASSDTHAQHSLFEALLSTTLTPQQLKIVEKLQTLFEELVIEARKAEGKQ